MDHMNRLFSVPIAGASQRFITGEIRYRQTTHLFRITHIRPSRKTGSVPVNRQNKTRHRLERDSNPRSRIISPLQYHFAILCCCRCLSQDTVLIPCGNWPCDLSVRNRALSSELMIGIVAACVFLQSTVKEMFKLHSSWIAVRAFLLPGFQHTEHFHVADSVMLSSK